MSTGPKPLPSAPTPGKLPVKGQRQPGSGRKKDTLTVKQLKRLLKAEATWEKKTGKSVDDILMSRIHNLDESVPPTVQMQAIRLFKDLTMARLVEGGDNDKDAAAGPQIYLPELDADPANVVPLKTED